MSTSVPQKKTILRIKRKFCDIQGSDIIVLSEEPKPKRQRTVPWDELTTSFNASLSINPSKNTDVQNIQIEHFFDYQHTQNSKKHVFRRLMDKKSQSHTFQETKLAQHSQNRKLKILKQRRSGREHHFTKMKASINAQKHPQSSSLSSTHILQHDDFVENIDKTTFISTKNGPNKNAKHICDRKDIKLKLKIAENKLLQKQKASRSTKIATISQMNALRAKRNNKEQNGIRNRQTRSLFDNDLIPIWNETDTEQMNISYQIFDGYLPKHLQFGKDSAMDIREMNDETDYDIINIENVDITDDKYDYYELDEEADADCVIAAIQTRMEEKKRGKEKEKMEMEMKLDIAAHADDMNDCDGLDLEWKLEKIKNKHLNKHFSAKYEGPTFGYQDNSKESEESRFCEIERNDFMNSNQIQTYYENLINDEEEIEKEDERYICNQYPDEHELSEDECCLQNDYYPQYNDEYHENALDIDFFNEYDFN